MSLSASCCCSVAGISTWSTTTTTAEESSASTHLNGTKPNLNKLKPKAKLGRNSGETQGTQGTQGTRHKATASKEEKLLKNFRQQQQNERQSTQHGNGIQLHSAAAGELRIESVPAMCVCVPCTCMCSLYMCLCVCLCLVWQLPLAFTQQTNCLQFGRCFWGNLISSPSPRSPSSRHVPFVAFVIVEQLCSLTCHKRCSKCC